MGEIDNMDLRSGVRVNEEAPSTRERIIQESAKLMAKYGYGKTSMKMIGDVVGLHKSSIFHHFQSKESILAAILERPIAEVSEGLDSIVGDDRLKGTGQLAQAVTQHVLLLTKYADVVKIYHHDLGALSPENRERYLDMRRAYALAFESIVERAQSEGCPTLKGADVRIATYGILGMCNWLVMWYRPGGRLSPDDLAQTFVGMVLPDCAPAGASGVAAKGGV